MEPHTNKHRPYPHIQGEDRRQRNRGVKRSGANRNALQSVE